MDRIIGFVQSLPIPLPSRKIVPVLTPTEMISGDGEFNDEGLEDFMKLHESGVSYAVVAIMGPQNSGKSTLLNHLFRTNFAEMGETSESSWRRTTKGIWISKAPNLDPFTMVMDVEGTDGQQRGEDDTTFEKQTTLFSLAVADILVINMWCHDIGRVNAANWPLLKIIFEVMVQILKRRPRKTTLHFVIRDRTMTGDLKSEVSEKVEKIWEIVPKTEEFQNAPLTEFFNVEVDALSHYKYEKEQFKEEVVKLGKKIQGSIRAAGDRGDVPTSGFSLHAKRLWETIQQNKNLDLPSHNKMVATVRCEEIAMEKLKRFESDKDWLEAKEAAEIRLVSGFNERISSIISRYLSEYDAESKYFEEGARNAKRQYLESEALKRVHPAFISTADHLRSETLIKFKTRLEELLNEGGGYAASVSTCQESCEREFDERYSGAAIEQANWDASFVRRELVRAMKNHALNVRSDKLSQVVQQHQARLASKVSRHLNRIFNGCNEEGISWASIRSFVKKETDSAASAFCSEVAAFELNQTYLDQKLHDLKQCARNLVENKFKEETESVLRRMKESYVLSLAMNEEEPFGKCLKVLSTMAVIRLDERSGDDEEEGLLRSALIDSGDEIPSDDPLALDTWEEVPPEMTLITPRQCRDIWVQFKQDIEDSVGQILSAESHEYFEQLPGNSETSEGTESRRLPYWIRVGTWLLGFKDFVSFLWRRRFESFKEVIKPLVALVEQAIELVEDCHPSIKRKVKNGCKRMKGNYEQMMKKLKEVLKRFYNFMAAKYTRNSTMVQVVS